MLESNEPIEARRRRLAWRASRRGIKEMDILVGGFATAMLPRMEEPELRQFEQLLDTPDQELLAWFTAQAPVPVERDCPMLRALLAFRPEVTSP
jgi:antitoxin CptB